MMDPESSAESTGHGTLSAADLAIRDLGRCLLPSPVARHLGDAYLQFVGAADKVLVDDALSTLRGGPADPAQRPAFELAGPRDRIFFDPRTVRVGIVTCGGLCPGLNNVVRGLVIELTQGYGVRHVYGFRYGYEGLIARLGHLPLVLTPEVVAHIHHDGGTMLGSSRGSQDTAEIVDNLEANGIGILFVVGGDGSMRGALAVAAEVERRRLKIAIVGVPKTVDNDIPFIDRSFGFVSAYSAAVDVIRSARVEATGARDGIGLVKLMGRHSGFLACQAALASTEVDLVLVPEVPVTFDDASGVFEQLRRVLDRKGHAVVVVAEGAAQEQIAEASPGAATDKSGNVKLKDVGVFLRERIAEHFRGRGREVTVKYIDPSYAIRSVPACPSDSIYCWNMARNAVHAAMAGNTEMLIGRWHGRFVHVPMQLATRGRRQVDPAGDLWSSVIESTGQPRAFG
jgi:6-phosphofructokinase 1